MESILKALPRMPLSLQSDMGTEMKAAPFQSVLKKYKIHFCTTENATTKAAVVERFKKTLQTMIHHYVTATRSRQFVEALPLLVKTYNATYHSAIGMAPNDVTDANTEKVWQRLYATKWNIRQEHQMTSSREIKSGLARPGVNLPRVIQAIGPEKYFWSLLNYIQSQPLTEYPTWLARRSAGPSINRNCKKYRPRNITILKKFLDKKTRRGKTEYLIKWTGFPASFNSWDTDLIKIA